MRLTEAGLIVALLTPLAAAGPRGEGIFRRQGQYGPSKDLSSTASSSSASVPTTIYGSSLSTLSSDLVSSSSPATKTASDFSTSNESLSVPTAPGLQSLTQSTVANSNPSPILTSTVLSFPYGTGVTASGTTVEVATTAIVYTTLTTCPVTTTVVSGSNTISEVTTTLSTITLTTISTLCTKCVAPPKSSSEAFPSPAPSSRVTASASISASSAIYSFSQPSAGFPLPSSRPEIPSFASGVSSSINFGFPTAVSLTVSATMGGSSAAQIPGYSYVPSPSSVSGNGPLSNATTTVIPVFTPSLLGNGYGGGFVSTPSLYVTRLSFPYGPSEGVPPGYGFTSTLLAPTGSPSEQQLSTPLVQNATSLLPGYGLPSSTAFGVDNATQVAGSPTSGPAIIVSTVAIPIATTSNGTSAVVISGISTAYESPVVGSAGQVSALVSTVPFTTIGGSIYSTVETVPPFIYNSAESSTASSPVDSTILVTSTAANGNVTIKTSFPIAGLVSSTQAIVEASTPLPILVSYTASNGQVIVQPSTPAPTLISSTASNGQEIVQASILSPILVSSTASSGQVVFETSTPLPVLVSTTLSFGPAIVETPPSLGPTLVLASSTASNGEVMVGVSTAFPVPASFVIGAEMSANPGTTNHAASFGQVFVGTSTPVIASSTAANGIVIDETPSPVTEASDSPPLSVAGSPIVLGGYESPTLSPEQISGAPITLTAGSSVEQVSSSGQSSPTILTPVVGANGLTSLVAVPSPQEQGSSADQPAATVLTPIAGANGLTSLAVIPSPVIGANGLTSLAVFSTPVAAANGLTSPAVMLTPVVGANGLTSLAVLATPVVGANGLTSLAVGLEAGQGSTETPSPIEEYIPVAYSPSSLGLQPGRPTSPLVVPSGSSGFPLPSASSVPFPGGSSNSSVHVPLSPSAMSQYEGSGLRLSISYGIGLVSFIVVLILM